MRLVEQQICEGANNLYGCSLSEYLPHKDLKFDRDIHLVVKLSTPAGNATWYIDEGGSSFPVEPHDKVKELPPAPETLTPDIG